MSQAIRDLHWALSAPQMIQEGSTWYPLAKPKVLNPEDWYEKLKQQPDSLEAHILSNPTKRLGLYYEQLIKFALQNVPHAKLLMHNQPIFDGKRTMGAFDFVYANAESKIVHRECAVKFYLGIPTSSQSYTKWSDWWGPNKADRLDFKLEKLLNKQIKLSHTQQAQQFLQANQIKIDIQEIDLKGYLFYPFEKNMPAPKDFNPNHLKSYWLEHAQMHHLCQQSWWEILPKLRWLSPSISSQQLMSTAELTTHIKEYFQKNPSPVLVSQYAENKPGCLERQRYFITPNAWQQHEGNHEPSL